MAILAIAGAGGNLLVRSGTDSKIRRMSSPERPEKSRGRRVRVDLVLQALPEPLRHRQAIRLCSDALEQFSRAELAEFRQALADDPSYWPFLSARTRAELVDLATGQIALVDAGLK